MDWLALILRWIHIFAAITAVGGTVFMRYALLPSAQSLTEDARKALHDKVRSRWAKIVMLCIAFLLISGLINFIRFVGEIKTPEWADWKATNAKLYHMVFGIKSLLALVIFFIASALVGRAKAFEPIRKNAKMWLTLNVILAMIVVALSGVLRSTHTGPSSTTTSNATSTEGGNG
jgi:uncharacterized membrane protein